MGLGWWLLFFVVALALILVGSCFYYTFWMKKAVFDELHALDEIRATGQPPTAWKGQYDLKKLKHIEAFMRSTKLVESEEVRVSVLNELNDIRVQWETRNKLGA